MAGYTVTRAGGVKQISIAKALWRGEIGLAKTFWLYNFVGTILLSLPAIVLEVTNPWLVNLEGPGEPGLGLLLLYIASSLGNRIWWLVTFVAISRSASNYDGLYDWAFLAKIYVSLGVATLLLGLANEITKATS